MPAITRSKSAAAKAARQKEQEASYRAFVKTITPVTPPRIQRVLECPPAPVKLDLSKMPKKAVSAAFVFPKSTEQKLAEAEAKVAQLEEALKKKDRELANAVYGMTLMSKKSREQTQPLKTENEMLKEEVKKLEKEMSAMWLENDALKKKCKNNDKELLDYMNKKTADIAELLGENHALKKRVDELVDRIQNPFKSAPRAPF